MATLAVKLNAPAFMRKRNDEATLEMKAAIK